MSAIGREANRDVWEWSRDTTGCPGVVGRPSWVSVIGREFPQMSGSIQQALPDVWEWS